MPSLRRTISSPAVRSSPYPSSLAAANNGGPALRSQGNGQRRSSGSETTSRRVLADIEWWRVADGQHDVEAEQGSEDPARGQEQEQVQIAPEQAGGGGAIASDLGVERPLMPFAWTPQLTGSPEASPLLPIAQLAALSIAPQSPPRRSHALESSSSSLESTPERPERSAEGLRLGMDYLDLGFPEGGLHPSSASKRGHSKILPAYLSIRAHSFSDYLTMQMDDAGQYADFATSPLSSHSPGIFN